MSTLVEISRKMNSSIELADILPAIVDIAKEYIRVKRVSLFLLEGEELRLKAYTGFAPELPVVIQLGEGITGSVAESGKEHIVNHSSTLNDEGGYTATSFMSLPLKTGEKITGVLNLTDKDNDFFNKDDKNIALFLASQCSLAVERYRLYQNMRGNERIKTIGMLRASVAHDIRNLLGIVEVYLSLMEYGGDMETMQEYINAIRAEIVRVQGLTNDIMLYTKEHIDLNYSIFNLCDLCSEIATQYNLSLKYTDISVKLDTRDCIDVVADRDRLFRAIFNLVNNAVHALDEKGTVTLRVREIKSAQMAAITICDNGKGIPKHTQTKIFDPFVTSGKAQGTGLGLAIVNEVIRAHAGVVKLRSVEGKYTLFQLKIPIKPDNK